jgi:hypothetical protein
MQRAYLGLATAQRLLLWIPETEHAAPFVLRRAARTTGAVGFWAVVPDTAACQMTALLDHADGEGALRLLHQAAVDVGPIVPPESDTVPVVQRLS